MLAGWNISRVACRQLFKTPSLSVISKPQQLVVRFPKTNFSSKPRPRSRKRYVIFGFATGVGVGVAYSLYEVYKARSQANSYVSNSGSGYECTVLKELPNVPISREVKYSSDASGLKFVLFQYPTCPFCCKVRAFLDFHGLSYDVVEVDPILKQQLKWSDYKKVPTLLVKSGDEYIQLNDSSMIISALSSYLLDKELSIKKMSDYYPTISYKDSDGVVKNEIFNRYFLMFRRSDIINENMKEVLEEERKWRQWADKVLVHDLSPNVYRTYEEAFQSFEWFSEVGNWEKLFPAWERLLIVYGGSFAMWLIGKRIKKKYNLKDDVRQSLYDDCNAWLKELNRKGTVFLGGDSPNLADLAVYGVLTSIEGCQAFNDVLKNTKLQKWYEPMRKLVSTQAGSLPVYASGYR